jgi:hypothetical protein
MVLDAAHTRCILRGHDQSPPVILSAYHPPKMGHAVLNGHVELRHLR